MLGGYVTCADEEMPEIIYIDLGIIPPNMNVHSYLVEVDDGYIIFDAGYDLNVMEKALLEKEISPLDIQYVLLTHSDYDHVASLPLFANAQIFMSEDEMQMVNGTTKRTVEGIGLSLNLLPDDVNLDEISLLHNGQLLEFGEHIIECIKVPGHTPGSMAYVLDDKYLFTGDAFAVENDTMAIHPYTSDIKAAVNSITKLRDLKNESELVLTAHYRSYSPKDLKYDAMIKLQK
jgi:glyoxylase-like metal-dependent hydrolase (beta-lactamase superfamily II)